MPTAYISGPLHAARDLDSARLFYEDLARICEEVGFGAYVPHLKSDPVRHKDLSCGDVFDMDHAAVSAADVIVADIGAPSLGVGAELAFAHMQKMPIIALYGVDQEASRFIRGLVERSWASTILVYADRDECRKLLMAALNEVRSVVPARG